MGAVGLLLSVFVFGGALVEVGGVGVAAAGHRDVEQCAAGVFAEDGVAGVGGDALGGVHGDRVAEADVLAQVVAFEDDAGAVVEAFGGNAIGLRVDAGHPPPVPVAHRRHRLSLSVAWWTLDGGVVAAADDQVPDADASGRGRTCRGRPRLRSTRW